MVSGPGKYVAFLLIGFDSTSLSMDQEIQKLIRSANLSDDEWTLKYKAWPNVQDNCYRIRCWFWYRPA
jgi:hypothetical protein